ncbi:MAG: hypothetical protein JNK74_03510 [Candidatus Hydrogenedentes bacterium]|nr:hypothetical protein [Candidatus Hydrogenedentota bacterium]
MIVLSSPPPRKAARQFFLSLTILGALGLLIKGAVDFGQLPEAWSDPDRLAVFNIVIGIAMGLAGMAAAAWQIVHHFTGPEPLQRLVATEETLAIKTLGKPILFVKRRNCIALSHDGSILVLNDGSRVVVHAYGADKREMDAFLRSLYELWWPRLIRADVQAYLKQREPRIWPLLFLPIATTPLFTLVIINLDSRDSVLTLTGILFGALIASFGFIGWCFYRVQISIARNQYPLHDTNER